MAELAAGPNLALAGKTLPRPAEWVRLPGANVSTLTMTETVHVLGEWIAGGRSHYVCVADVHSLMHAHRHADHRAALLGADLVTPDGAPIVLMARLAGIEGMERVCGPDLFLEMCAMSAVKGWRNYYYGGKSGVADRLADRMRQLFPGLEVVGTAAPPFRAMALAEIAQHVSEINDTQPHLVWIGLGCPKQEKWMAENSAAIPGAVLVGVGAAFDFHSGQVQRAPKMMRRLGLEWAHRLVSDPRRLWRRYLVMGPMFLGLSALHLATGRIRKEA